MATSDKRISSWAALAGFIALCLAVGAIADWVTWQWTVFIEALAVKPTWTPPSEHFRPVWTVLSAMTGFAAWRVWSKDARFAGVKAALILFFVLLTLNLLWSLSFIGLRSPGITLITSAALLLILILTVWAFFQQSRWAGLMMLPYLAWVAFAAALNFAIWRLN